MNIIESFNLKLKDIVTIVGAGGKTSVMYSASSILRKNYKVLVTTTTHIYIPQKYEYDELVILENVDNNELRNILNKDKNGIYVIANNQVDNIKLKGLNFEQLDKVIDYFDYVFIEGDGSKRKPLKGWNDNEPVIYPKTTKHVGVLDISTVGMKINEDNIHRIDKFKELINYDENKSREKINNTKNNEENKLVTMNNLLNVILKKQGLFKNNIGSKILLINKAESKTNIENSKKLSKQLKLLNKKYINKIVYGSVRCGEFKQ